MTTTLASATQIAEDRLSILVETSHADSLYRFLKEKKVECLPPSGAIFRPRRAYIDGAGRRQIEEDTLVSDIVAKGTFDDFAKWMGEWVLPKP